MVDLPRRGGTTKGTANMLNLQELRGQLAEENRTTKENELTTARKNFVAREDLSQVLMVAAALDNAGLKKGHYEDGWRVHAGYSGWTIYADLNVEGFLEAHDARLATVLAAVAAALPGCDWKSYDNPAAKNRSFQIDGKNLTVCIGADLKDDSTKCKRVVVGKKTVEQEIYEFRCDGEEVTTA